eukprot:m.479073 g.479073  ORF g.479073 m.479073 type:complete len:1416 (+) comp21312_c0_seq1:275-4522(+)
MLSANKMARRGNAGGKAKEYETYLNQPDLTLTESDWDVKGVWVPDENDGFVMGRVEGEEGDKVLVKRSDTREVQPFSNDDVLQQNPPKFRMAEDMANLTHLNEATVLYNLKDRYYANLQYTYSGLFCVAVNPYQWYPIFSEDVIKLYSGQKRQALPPHVFAIAQEALKDMRENGTPQSILCTGESGAGKTENTKKVIQFLAYVARPRGPTAAQLRRRSSIGLSITNASLHEQLLAANPILETFGNAKTIKNDNSSRFGKFIRIHFDKSGYITGGDIQTYLLEKSRVVAQLPPSPGADSERNFHAFYQLLEGADAQTKEDLLLSTNKFKILCNHGSTRPGVSDESEFKGTVTAMKAMGMSEAEISSVWRSVAAILHVGDIVTQLSENRKKEAIMTEDTVAQRACHLLGIPHADFGKGLITPKNKVHGEWVKQTQTLSNAINHVEALAKSIFERLFLWIVERINTTLSHNTRESVNFIGLLDIAGFEIFQVNSFEQLCINYTNENLQQLFNRRMFTMEQQEYEKEGIQWDYINFGHDLDPTIYLLGSKSIPGLLLLLDEVAIFPKGTDQQFMDRVSQQLKKLTTLKPPEESAKHGVTGKAFAEDIKSKFVLPGVRERATFDFGVVHYAGKVDYKVDGWVEKNKDPENQNIKQLLAESSNDFVRDLFSPTFSSKVAGKGAMKTGRLRTVSEIFQDNLKSLLDMLSKTNTHYIRCIIPNHKKRGGEIDANIVLGQLRCNGVIEGIRIVRKGFPNRMPYAEFKQRYQILATEGLPKGFVDSRVVAEKIIQGIGLDPEQYRLGTTKVFFKAGILGDLEKQRELKVSSMMVGLQAQCRGWLARRAFGGLVTGSQAVTIVQRNVRSYLQLREWPWWKLFTKIKPLLPFTGADEKIHKMQEELDTLKKKMLEDEASRVDAEQSRDQLEDDKKTLEAQIRDDTDLIESLQQVIAKHKQRKFELDETIQRMDDEVITLRDREQRLMSEKASLDSELSGLKSSFSEGKEREQARIEQLEGQVRDYKAKLEETQTAQQELEGRLSQLKHDNSDLQEQLDLAVTAKARAVKSQQKLQSEVDDLKYNLNSEKQRVATFQAKQKQFDEQLREERRKLDAAVAERDTAEQQKRELQTQIMTLKGQSEDLTAQVEAAEKSKRRLMAELEESAAATSSADAAALETKIRQLQTTVDEQQQQIVELEDELQHTEDEKLRLEVKHNALKREMEDTKMVNEEEEIRKRETLKRQLKAVEEELDLERRAKSKIAAENKKSELDIQSLQEQLEEETRARAREQNSVKKLQRKLEQVMTERSLDAEGDQRLYEQIDGYRARIKELKTQIAELDDSLALANREKRRAVVEKEEHEQHADTYEREIRQLRSQLRRARVAADDTSITSTVDVKDDETGYHAKYTFTEKETITSRRSLDSDADA